MSSTQNTPMPALFLHIQKTAGTSIIHQAIPYYQGSYTSHGDCWGKHPDDLRQYQFISGHIGYDYAKHLMENRYSFTFLRDPIERIISMYYFCKYQSSNAYKIYEAASRLNFKDFLYAGLADNLIKKNIWNNQTWQMAHGYAHLDDRKINDFSESEMITLAKKHIIKLSYVGLTETYALDTIVITQALGIAGTDTSARSNVTENRPDASVIPSEEMHLLKELTKLDYDLYNYVKSIKNDKQPNENT